MMERESLNHILVCRFLAFFPRFDLWKFLGFVIISRTLSGRQIALSRQHSRRCTLVPVFREMANSPSASVRSVYGQSKAVLISACWASRFRFTSIYQTNTSRSIEIYHKSVSAPLAQSYFLPPYFSLSFPL